MDSGLVLTESFPETERRDSKVEEQKLSDSELFVFAHAACVGLPVGDIRLDSFGEAVLVPPKFNEDDNDSKHKWTKESYFEELNTTIAQRTGNDVNNEKVKINQFFRFLKSLRDNEKFGPLASLVPHPDDPAQKTLRFVALTQNKPNDAAVKKIVNTCMLCWALGKNTI